MWCGVVRCDVMCYSVVCYDVMSYGVVCCVVFREDDNIRVIRVMLISKNR